MDFDTGSGIARSLDRIRAEVRGLDLVELARRLFAFPRAPEPALARRLLSAALGCPPESLPDHYGATELAAARHGCLADGRGAQALERPLAGAAFVVVDLETTGLSAQSCSIVEIGALRLEGLRPVAAFHTLVDPGMPLPPRIGELLGIEPAELDGAPAPGPALAAFRRWLEGARGAALVAHNARFDAAFLRRGFAEHGLGTLPGPLLCTLRLGRRLRPRLGAYHLDALCASFGIRNPARHRALPDAEATARLLVELLGLTLARDPDARVGDLLELQAAPPAPSAAAGR